MAVGGVKSAHKYVQIPEENLELTKEKLNLGSDFIFQQDNAPAHMARITKKYFAEK